MTTAINNKFCACYKQVLNSEKINTHMERRFYCGDLARNKYRTFIESVEATPSKYKEEELDVFYNSITHNEANLCIHAKKDFLEEGFNSSNLNAKLRLDFEKLIGTSFNLSSPLDCFKDKIISDLAENPNINIFDIETEALDKQFIMEKSKAFMIDCFIENSKNIGTDDVVFFDKKYFFELSSKIVEENKNDEFDVKRYIECIFEKVNGKITSKEWVNIIDDLEDSTNPFYKECYQVSLFEK